MNEKKTNAVGILLLVITAVVWGFAFVAQTVGSDHVNAFTFNAIRFAIGTGSLIPVILLFERDAADQKRRSITRRAGFLCGLVLFAASTLQQYGIELYQKAGFSDGSGRAGFLTALYMVIVPLIGLLFRKRPSVETWFGILLAVGGLFLISFTDGFSVGFEDLVVIGCAILFAVQIVAIDRFGEQLYSLRFAMTEFGVCAAASAVFAVGGMALGLVEMDTLADFRAAAVPILYGGFMSVGVAYTLQIVGQKRTDPAVASMIMSTESMFSAIGGALILGETMTIRGYLGCGLIFAGILMTQMKLFGRKRA